MLKIKTMKLLLLPLFVLCVCSVLSVQSRAEGERILIQVEPNTIAMPKNIEIARVPVSAARIRSTELRVLNEKYNAVSIERLYKVDGTDKSEEVQNEGILVSREKKKVETQIGSTKVFTKEKRKELLTQSQDLNIVEVKNAFLLQFKPDKNFNINQVLNEYDALSVVLFAQYCVITEQTEKEKKEDK